MMQRLLNSRHIVSGFLILMLSACASTPATPTKTAHSVPGYRIGAPYNIEGEWYYPKEDFSYDETGVASWYGPGFHGHYTANGEIFDTNQLTAAHKTLPLPSLVRVTNLENGRQIVVRINDRGPFSANRIIDMSKKGAELLGFYGKGTAKVRVQILKDESLAIKEAALHITPRSEFAEVRKDEQVAAATEAPVSLAAPRQAVTSEVLLPPVMPTPAPSPQKLASNQPESKTPAPVFVPGHKDEGGLFMPAPIVTKTAVDPAHTRLFVQAGAFSLKDNAERLKGQLTKFGPASIDTKTVNGQIFYRVRVGPFPTVDNADAALTKVIKSGQKTARIIVD